MADTSMVAFWVRGWPFCHHQPQLSQLLRTLLTLLPDVVQDENMRQPWPPQSKMVLGILLPVYKNGKFPFFITKLSGGRHDSTNFAEKVISPKFLASTPFCEQILCESAAYEPQANTAGNGEPRKSGGQRKL
jgi:hypothetical protein